MSEKVKDIIEWIICIIIALILALLFRHYISTPTIVKQRSMFPTLKSDERLILNRTFRITHKSPKVGDIVTFEAPSDSLDEDDEIDQTNPVAVYNYKPKNIFDNFLYNCLEFTKISYIKRVIALEGDHVKIENGKVYVNGKELKEDYLDDSIETKSRVYNDFTVPEGYFFAMGDNRNASTDCREFGCIPLDKLEGIVIFRFWPLNVLSKF